mmetsp:Transcript_16333/g.23265  ORF Transcript_16333/g.23265 Transcript_16333/m.23265 type:complete len:84 (-) Transcript_16333:22-273(-)
MSKLEDVGYTCGSSSILVVYKTSVMMVFSAANKDANAPGELQNQDQGAVMFAVGQKVNLGPDDVVGRIRKRTERILLVVSIAV